MRIIAGQAKGRRILSVSKDAPVRPILARIRQSLFDILRPRVPGSAFLDLYAGTGAVGLEALSRGAAQVVFVDFHRTSLKVVERNLEHLGFTGRGKALKGDASGPLSWLLFHTSGRKFDLVFMGPPYVDKEGRPLRLTGKTLAQVAASGLLTEEAWVVAQHHKKEAFDAPEPLELFRREKYGDSTLSFLRMPKGGPRLKKEDFLKPDPP